MIWVDVPNEALKTQFKTQLPQFCCGIQQSCRLRCCALQPLFCYLSDSSTQKYCLMVMLQRKNVFVVIQSEATKNNSHDQLIRHVKDTIFMEIVKQFREKLNFLAYMSDCMIENSNLHRISFGQPRHFFWQFTFNLHLAWNVFDCLLQV